MKLGQGGGKAAGVSGRRGEAAGGARKQRRVPLRTQPPPSPTLHTSLLPSGPAVVGMLESGAGAGGHGEGQVEVREDGLSAMLTEEAGPARSGGHLACDENWAEEGEGGDQGVGGLGMEIDQANGGVGDGKTM